MEGKLKIIILVLVALLVISLLIVFGIQSSKLTLLREYNYIRERLTQENERLTNKLNSILAENRSLQDKLEVIQRDLERISSERDRIQRSYELVNKEREELLERSRSYAQLQKDLESLENENKILKEQINALEKHKFVLEADLNELRRNNESLKQKIEEAKYSLKEETLMAGYMEEPSLNLLTKESEVRSINLPLIVVSPQISQDIGLFSSLEGEILNLNTEYNFVVIDLGRHTGVREGMVFEVFRRGKLLGKVEVIQLRSEIAACDIIQADMPLRIGDIVRY